ncbi:enhanced serine sensitivity protein SseB C-terminal domain-containing protein [Amedibacillus dolichus]|uniref:SseB protein N-terminal domain-containing protein n=1 Tax=Amedibacillus dolichus DSM 3991 TaxID=428127 RepID=A8RF05_9FIRM|nr:enhanced serine sensitivity protein SseB C-terminal domain-containing protein [Amedibacillus dolichus]EDP10106.1 hypothetical protein EUBDOL_02120 [Amedibacillus dolichus DSM 3991]
MSNQESVINPGLIEAIHIMRAQHDEQTVNHMLNEAVRAKYLAPVIFKKNAQGDEEMQLSLMKSKDGKKFLMAFTDWSQVHRWKKGGDIKTAVLSFDDYAKLIVDEKSGIDGFIINPFGENLPFFKEIVADLIKQKQAFDAEASEPQGIEIDDAKDVSQELLTALTQYMEKEAGIRAAYLREMKRGNRQSYLIVVDFEGERETIFKQIADCAVPHLHDLYLDMIPMDSVGEGILDDAQPFYCVKGYQKPIIKNPSAAIIEDIFDLKDGKGCVLACYVIQEGFAVGDEVDVITAQGRPAFKVTIQAIEVQDMRVQNVQAGGNGMRCGILIEGHKANEFYAGLRLLKANH